MVLEAHTRSLAKGYLRIFGVDFTSWLHLYILRSAIVGDRVSINLIP